MRPMKTVIPTAMLAMLLASCARQDQGEPEIIEDEIYPTVTDEAAEATEEAAEDAADAMGDGQHARPDPGDPELPDDPAI
ncbi:hypothetical protein [Parasphingorhabdus sp.]|uniref:hypothetical protein n=1 Tax=Parasphingorhabdus sp. TaxID=2709688 RepID=UPI003A902362